MGTSTSRWQFSIRTMLLFFAVLSLWCGLIVAWQGLGVLLTVLLHGVAFAIIGNRSGSLRLERSGYGLVAAPLLIFFFACYTVHKTWFSPDNFTFRTTQHTEAFGIPLTHGTTAESIWPLIDYLRAEGYIDDVAGPASNWDFVHGHMPSVKGWMGDAKNAYRAFRSEELIDWSKSHPEQAAHVWPIIVAHTRARQYYLARIIVMELHGFEGTVEELDAKVKYCEANWNK
jgi:hypothetical protein